MLVSTTFAVGIGPTQSWQPDSIEVQLTVGQLELSIVVAFARMRRATDARLNGGAVPVAPAFWVRSRVRPPDLPADLSRSKLFEDLAMSSLKGAMMLQRERNGAYCAGHGHVCASQSQFPHLFAVVV